MDRLSSLPDTALHRILSFVDNKTLVRTSALSKKWRHFWITSPSVDLNWREDWPINFVERILDFNTEDNITNFKISLPHDAIPSRHIDSWVDFLTTHSIKQLNLEFLADLDDDELESATLKYKLPQSVFISKTLTSLSLTHCEIDIPDSVLLPNLRTIYLRMINLSDMVIKSLVLGCPHLEDLTLHDCNMLDELKIDLEGSRMKSLRINEWQNYIPEMPVLELVAPDLFSMEFLNYMPRSKYVVKNLASLVVASFSFDEMLDSSSDYIESGFMDVLCQIHYLEVLKLCSGCVVELSLRKLRDSRISVPLGVSTLELKTGLCKFELPGFACLLRRLINLEVLNINVVEEDESCKFKHLFQDNDFDETEHWKLLETFFEKSRQHIKTVKIHGMLVRSKYIDLGTKFAVVKDVELQKKLISWKTTNVVVEGASEEEGFIAELMKIILKKSAIMEMQIFAKNERHYLNLVFRF